MARSDKDPGIGESQRITQTRLRPTTDQVPLHAQPASALMAHLKAMLANIVFETARADHDEVSLCSARRTIKRIASAAHLMDRLLGDLNDLPELEAGRLRLDRRRTDFSRLVIQVLNGLTPEQRRRIRFEARDHAIVLVDADRIERVTATMIENALGRAVDTEVCVRLERKTELAVLRIADHGPGLTAHQTRGAFDPVSVDTGMPLYVGRKLVELHGGRITVDTVPSKGTWFAIELPVIGSR
jgi:signal transduction histidine kinase